MKFLKSILGNISGQKCSIDLPDPRMFPLFDKRGRLKKHCIPINKVAWGPVEKTAIADDTAIVGFHIESQAYAITWKMLSHHHVANLSIEQHNIAIVWCGMCSGVFAYNSNYANNIYRFRAVALLDGNIVMSDYETDTLWYSFSGEAFSGKEKGKKLDKLNITQCTWREWMEANRDTLLAFDPYLKSFGKYEKPGRDESHDIFDERIAVVDKRLPALDLVLGVELNNQCYAFEIVKLKKRAPVINQQISGRSIVIFINSESWLVSAYYNRIDGRELTFATDGCGIVHDTETNSAWNYFGHAVSGRLKGMSLEPCSYTLQAWYAWSAAHPDTNIVASLDTQDIE